MWEITPDSVGAVREGSRPLETLQSFLVCKIPLPAELKGSHTTQRWLLH